MTANFVTPLDHALEKLDVVCIPCDLAPVEALALCPHIAEYGVNVGDQEKRGREIVSVKNWDGLLELASQSVIERQRNERWFVHSRLDVAIFASSGIQQTPAASTTSRKKAALGRVSSG